MSLTSIDWIYRSISRNASARKTLWYCWLPKMGPCILNIHLIFSSRLLKDNGPTLAQHCPPQMAPQCSVNSNTRFKQTQKEQSKIANKYIIYDEWRAWWGTRLWFSMWWIAISVSASSTNHKPISGRHATLYAISTKSPREPNMQHLQRHIR